MGSNTRILICSEVFFLIPAILLGAPAYGSVPASFTCCGERAVDEVIAAYLELQEALAAGKKSAGRHLSGLGKHLEDHAGLDPVDVAVFRDLSALVDKLDDKGVDGIRADFDDISRNVIFLALRHEGGHSPVAEAFCSGRGSWLQADLATIRDPWGVGCGEWRE